MSIEFTAKQSGYFRVFVNGVEVSRHTTEREALESATAQEAGDPLREVEVRHDYSVKVEDTEAPASFPVGVPVKLRLVASNPALVDLVGEIIATPKAEGDCTLDIEVVP